MLDRFLNTVVAPAAASRTAKKGNIEVSVSNQTPSPVKAATAAPASVSKQPSAPALSPEETFKQDMLAGVKSTAKMYLYPTFISNVEDLLQTDSPVKTLKNTIYQAIPRLILDDSTAVAVDKLLLDCYRDYQEVIKEQEKEAALAVLEADPAEILQKVTNQPVEEVEQTSGVISGLSDDTGSSASPITNQQVSEDEDDSAVQVESDEEEIEQESPVLRKLKRVLDSLIGLIQERISVLSSEGELSDELETLYADLDHAVSLRENPQLHSLEDDEVEEVINKIEIQTQAYVQDLVAKRSSSVSEKDSSNSGAEGVSSVTASPQSGRYSPAIFVPAKPDQEAVQKKQEAKERLEKMLSKELAWVENKIRENHSQYGRVNREKNELRANPKEELGVDPFGVKVKLLGLMREQGFAELANQVDDMVIPTLEKINGIRRQLGTQGNALKGMLFDYYDAFKKLETRLAEKEEKLTEIERECGALGAQRESIDSALKKVRKQNTEFDDLLALEKERARHAKLIETEELVKQQRFATEASLEKRRLEAEEMLKQTLSTLDTKIQEKTLEMDGVKEASRELDADFAQKRMARFAPVRFRLRNRRNEIFMYNGLSKQELSLQAFEPKLEAIEADQEKSREDKIKDLVTTGWFTRLLFNISSRYKKDLRQKIGQQLDEAKAVNELEAYLSKKDSSFDYAPRDCMTIFESLGPEQPLFEVFLSQYFQEKRKYRENADEHDRKLIEIQGELSNLKYERSRAPAKISLMYSQLVEVGAEHVERTMIFPGK